MSLLHTLFTDSVRTKRPADVSRIRSAVKALASNTSSSSHGAFSPLCDCVDRTLLIWKGVPAVTSAAQETAVRIALIDPTHLALPLLSHLSSRLDCRDKAVRLRSCQLLGRLVQGIHTLRKGNVNDDIVAEGAPIPITIPDVLWTQLSSRLASRTKDRLPAIRSAACFATAQLQRPTSSSTSTPCLSLAALRWSMSFDSSPDVRATAVAYVFITEDTLSTLIERAQDSSATVRSAALIRLRTSYPWSSSSSVSKRSLIGPGLADPSVDVVKATWLLLASWLHQCNWDILAFLEGLDFVTPYALAADPDGTAEDTAASGFLPSHAAMSAERVSEAALWGLFTFVETPQPKRSFTTNSIDIGAIDPADLWSGVKECFETYMPSAQALQPEAAFYWRMRAAWLTGARSFSGGGGGSLVANSISLSSSTDDRRAELLDALLPDAATLCDVARDVALGLGCFLDDSTADASALATAAEAAVTSVASGGSAWSVISSPGSAVSAFRQLSLANGVAAPTKLAMMRQVPVHADPDALCTLRQLLILAQLVDYGDEMGRRKTIRLALQILPQPALPSWAIYLVARTLVCAFGCGKPCEAIGGIDAMNERFHNSSSSSMIDESGSSIGGGDAFCESVSLQIALIGSLRAAVDVCMALAESESAEGGGGQSESELAIEKLRNRAEQLRQLLEEDEDSGGKNANSIREELERIEDAVAEAVSAADINNEGGSSSSSSALSSHQLNSVGFTVALDGVELRTHDASELAGLLWLRALTITEALLRGSNISPALQQRHLSQALSQVSTLALGPAIMPSVEQSDDGGPLLSLWQRLVQPSLVSTFLEVKAAGVRCLALLALSSINRAAGAQMTRQASSLLYSIALDSSGSNTLSTEGGGNEDDIDALAAAAASQTALRVAAIQALCDLGCTFGLTSVTNEGMTLLSLLNSLIQPKVVLKNATSSAAESPTSGPAFGTCPLTLQLTAAQGLSRLLLSGTYTLSLESANHGSCLSTSSASSSSTSSSSSSSVGVASTGTSSTSISTSSSITLLADFYFALLWHEAYLYASSKSVTTRAISSSLASALSSFSALSPLHQMITLSSLVKAYRNMMESLGHGSLLLPVNTVTTSSSFLSWAQSVFPAVESLSAKIQGTTNNNTGKTTKTDSIDDGATEAGDGNIDDTGSVQSGVSAMLPGGSSSSSSSAGQLAAAAAAWLSEALCLCIHISGLVPLKSKSGEVHDGSAASLVLPSWASSATPSDLLCISLSIDAASDANAGKNTAPFARVLIQALKLVTPRGNLQENEEDEKTTTSSDRTRALTTSATISAAISYSLSELSKACVVHLKSASVSKTVQKLLTAWTTTGGGGGGGVSSATTEATNAVKALLIERTTSAQKSQLSSSSGGVGGGKKGGLGLQSSVAGPRLGTGRAASRGKSYAED